MKVHINNLSTEQEFVNLHILQQKQKPHYKAVIFFLEYLNMFIFTTKNPYE